MQALGVLCTLTLIYFYGGTVLALASNSSSCAIELFWWTADPPVVHRHAGREKSAPLRVMSGQRALHPKSL
jgi:hypothetical protein